MLFYYDYYIMLIIMCLFIYVIYFYVSLLYVHYLFFMIIYVFIMLFIFYEKLTGVYCKGYKGMGY